jgi:hypothetical protein
MAADLPKKLPTVDQVNQGAFAFDVTLENTGKEELVLWPFLAAELMDAQGNSVKRSRYIGRWGFRVKDSVIESIPFVTLAPGRKHTFKVAINAYTHHPLAITGWKLPKAGEYRLELHYKYDRAEARKKWGRGCKDLDNPDRPWNRAYEVDKKLNVSFKVVTGDQLP